jgi:hypothetical protein
MKKIILFIAVPSLVFSSCQKELNFDNSGVSGGGSTGGTTGGGSSTNCKACVYVPVCNGAYYTFYDTLSSGTNIIADTFRVIKDTTIAGKTFAKIFSPLTKAYNYYNCTDGATRVIGYNKNTAGGNTLTVVDITLIKANLPVGATWQDNITNPLGQQVVYNSKIVAKSISRTINGQVFPDVIHVYTETGIDLPLLGFTVLGSTDYYFARGVGLVEAVIEDPNSGTVIQHRAIKNYFIP